MARRSQDYLSQTDFRGGINTEPENAAPNQVLDARNVWAPQGKLVQRPGYQTLGHVQEASTSSSNTGAKLHTWNSAGTLTATYALTDSWDLNSLAVGAYFGISFPSAAYGTYSTFSLNSLTNTNSAATSIAAEYWNGTVWANLPNFTPNRTKLAAVLDTTSTNPFFGLVPRDAATETNTGQHTIRFKLLANAFDSTVNDTSLAITYYAHNYILYGMQAWAFPQFGGFVTVTNDTDDAQVLAVKHVNYLVSRGEGTTELGASTTLSSSIINYIAPTFALLPDVREMFVAFFNDVARIYFSGTTLTADFVNSGELTVEDRDIYVGTVEGIKSPYHPDYVAQLEEFPIGKYVLFHKNVLFVAGLQYEPYSVYWSAPSPAHRVFPAESYEVFSDTDNSPITGLSTFGEHVVVFRRDSIWLLVDNGINDLGMQQFLPVKVVDGVGCVAHSTIQRIPGALLFLAEDGVYRFDGSPNIVCISKHIDSVIQGLNQAAIEKAVSVHWQSQKHYLLSVADGSSSTQNLVLAYDYAHNAWWLWDIEVSVWLRLEDAQDRERIYFIGNNNLMSELGPYPTDWGTTITSYVKTQRFAYQDRIKKRFGEVYIEADNEAHGLSVEVEVDDEAFGTNLTLDFRDDSEAKWDTAKWDTSKWVQFKRREKRGAVRKTGEWCSIKVTNSTPGTEMNLNGIHVGAIPLGRR